MLRLFFISAASLLFIACSSQNQLPRKPVEMVIADPEPSHENGNEKNSKPPAEPEPVFIPERAKDSILDPKIKSVRFRQKGSDFSLPILELNAPGRIELSFDDLRGDLRNYSYLIKHHNADGSISLLTENEYIDGFPTNYIDSYTYSLNTLQPFVHYTLELPNQNVQFLKSGLYTVHVFANNNPEETILIQKFYILEQRVSIEAEVKRATMVSKREEYQEVDFVIQTGDYTIDDPFSGLYVEIQQNGRTDNKAKGLKPIFIRDNLIDFNLEGPNVFKGGNEFRYVDMRSIRFLGDQIKKSEQGDSLQHIYLINDPKRSFQVYTEMYDINGERVYNTTDGSDPDREADYVWTHFTLPYSYEIDQPVYVFGALSGWKLLPEFKMEYNEERGAYEAQILLKQGYYNYGYAIDSEDSGADLQFFEGSHFQTENQYQILVFNRKPGTRYDALVGFTSLNSRTGF